jgi:hypothetical protein
MTEPQKIRQRKLYFFTSLHSSGMDVMWLNSQVPHTPQNAAVNSCTVQSKAGIK